jgi:uncharacterized protein DUF3617
MRAAVWGCGLGLGALLASVTGAAAEGEGLQDGLWRVLNRPQINGVAGPESQNMRCLTPADVKDLAKTFSPIARTTNSACEQVENEFTASRLKWRLQCRGQLDMDVAGEFVFDRPDHYSATVVASSSMMGQPMQTVRTEIDAHRVGPCQ